MAMPPSEHAAPERAAPPALAFMPLGAPTLADGPVLTNPRTAPQPVRPHPRQAEPDELFQAWHRSVRNASGRRQKTGRDHGHLVRVGVPIVVIVTVGVGAVMMLTGKTNSVLDHRAEQGKAASGAQSGVAKRGASGTLTAAGFSGYPGQRGPIMVSSIANAGGTQLAAGSADGHPAIWRHAGSGAWQLVSAASPAVYRRPGVEMLTSIAHGPAGWIAVGGVVSGAPQQSVVVTSTDGVTWRTLDSMAAFAGRHTFVEGVAAGHGGYVVVGKHVNKGRVYVGMWWSADLQNWVIGDNGDFDGRILSSMAHAVAAVPGGFVAVGTHGNCHTIWVSPNGRAWTAHDIRVPAGASSAMLNRLAVNGNHVAAGGYAVTKAGNIPIVVVSVDGGAVWHQIELTAPGGLGAVTALAAAGSGFVAAGQAGPAGAQHAVTWSTGDSLSWSAPTSAGNGAGRITALAAIGATVTGTAQHGTDPSLLTLPAP